MTALDVESGASRANRNIAAAGFSLSGGVAEQVANALYWDCAVPRHRIVARCDDGWVTLTGEVERAYQRSSAEADVKRVSGVKGVTNAITVGVVPREVPNSRCAASVSGGALIQKLMAK